jgi:hypothetical protein
VSEQEKKMKRAELLIFGAKVRIVKADEKIPYYSEPIGFVVFTDENGNETYSEWIGQRG